MKDKLKKKIGVKDKATSLDMRFTLIMFAVIPMIISVIIVGAVMLTTSIKELKQSTYNSLISVIKQTGNSFDYSTERNENTIQNFIEAPIVREFLKNPDDAELAEKAQAYTVNYFGQLDGWEGIYIADWNSKVLTHPAPPVVGKVMREGDRLKELQDAMLAADGVYNVGIIESPASGQLIMSMYAAVYDENDQPIGYVGAGTFVNNAAAKITDVSSLGLKSAYVYFVDNTGIMLYHPDETKIGNAVENEAVKGLVARLEKGEEIKPDCVSYKYKGAMKYAAYYVGKDDAYIAVLTTDEKDVMAEINKIIYVAIAIIIICVALFMAIAIFISNIVSKPLTTIADATTVLSTGDVAVECDTKSGIKETLSIINAFKSLKNALMSSMSNVKNLAKNLNTAIVNVDGMTVKNVESITQISTAIDEVASTSQAVAENAQIMSERAIELGHNVETLNSNISSLYDFSLSIKNVNEEATDCMHSVYSGAKESVEAVQNIADKIKESNAAIEKIEKVVEAIEAIAQQTNLLSLNASIEAARAGEAGVGFAVVATEIRTLADSSAASVQEIRKIIENIINLSTDTVRISENVFEVINREQSDIENAQKKFDGLSESVESSISEIERIKAMAGELDSIKVELTNATSELGAISEELGASAEEVAASCQTVSAACMDTQSSTQEMRQINEQMSEAIDFFKL